MILFADLDGVVHPHIGYRPELLFCKLRLLENVLRQRPGVEVVISSTWRLQRSLPDLRQIFSDDIAPRVIGVTPQWEDFQDQNSWGAYVRQAEIEAWMREANRPWEDWIAVDDQAQLFRPFCRNLVLTDSNSGLTESVCEILLQKLA